MVPKHRAICEPNKAGKASSWEDPCHRPTEASTGPGRPHGERGPASRDTQRPWDGASGCLGHKNVVFLQEPLCLSCLWLPPVTCFLTALLTICLVLEFVSWLVSRAWELFCWLLLPRFSLLKCLVSARTLITCLIPQPYSRVLGLPLPWPHEPGSHPRI